MINLMHCFRIYELRVYRVLTRRRGGRVKWFDKYAYLDIYGHDPLVHHYLASCTRRGPSARGNICKKKIEVQRIMLLITVRYEELLVGRHIYSIS